MRERPKSFQDLIVWHIAEGFRKHSKQDKARLLNVAEGSLEECRYYLVLAHDLGHLEKRPLWELTEEVGRLLNAYRSAILTPNSYLLTPTS